MRAILAGERIVRLAFAVSDEPYIVPLCYGFDSQADALYVHTAAAGRKLDFARKNPRVCFEIEGSVALRRGATPCLWGLRYESLIGYGILTEVLAEDEKRHGLACLMTQQTGAAGVWTFSHDAVRDVRVLKLAIVSVTGKRAA